jgi:hypothetical protein
MDNDSIPYLHFVTQQSDIKELGDRKENGYEVGAA